MCTSLSGGSNAAAYSFHCRHYTPGPDLAHSFSRPYATGSPSVTHCSMAIPLLHGQTVNGPLLGLGFSMADKVAHRKKKEIIGVYFGNHDNSVRLLPHQQAIITRLAAQCSVDPLVLVVDTRSLQASKCCVFRVKGASNTGNAHSVLPVTLEAKAIALLHNALRRGDHLRVEDLYDHTNDISQNPLRSFVTTATAD